VSNTTKVPDLNNLYIGIEMDRQVEDISGLSLYFSLKNVSGKDRFFRSLPSSRWFLNEREFKFFQGIETSRDRSGGLEELFKQENDVSYRACKYVNDFFSKFFMTVEGKKIPFDTLSADDSLPDDMKKHYPAEVRKLIPDDLLWLRIELSQPISQEMIGELMVSLNCFPVINRGINEFTQSLKKGENIVPLALEDIFYDVRRISDSSGTVYEQSNSIQNEKSRKNTYVLRQGGMARFDSRDALETIDHLTDLVRNESAAFSILGSEMISSELKELDQIITRLKQRLSTSSSSYGAGSFVVLNSKKHNERVHVEFWATNGDLANNIRSGSKMNVFRGRDVNANSVFLLTNTTGGRQELSEEDKLNKLRRALLSKGRIVTREDIKALCFDHFGKDLHGVEIKNGVQAEGGPKKGLVQTLDISLFLKKQHKLSDEDLHHKEEGLKILLKQGSLNMVVYRIFIS